MNLALATILLLSPMMAVALALWSGRMHPLELPVFASGAFLFLYVWHPLYLIQQPGYQVFASAESLGWGVFMAALALWMLLLGWVSGPTIREAAAERVWSYPTMFRMGFLLSVTGIALWVAFLAQSGGATNFYSSPHGTAGAWQAQSAWVYLGPYLLYPGIALMVVAQVRSPTTVRWIPVLVIAIALLAHAILTSSRGTLFPTAVVLALPWYLASGRRPRIGTVIGGGLVLGAGLLLLVGYRDVLHLGGDGGSDSGVVEALLATSTLSEAAIRSESSGNEFLYHVALIEAVDGSGKLNLGVGMLYAVIVHPIPRLLWPDKPLGWNIGVTGDDVQYYAGWNVADGSAPGAVADLYAQFGWASLVVWFAMGFVGRRVLALADGGSPGWIIAYTVAFCWSLHFFSQGMGAIVVPGLYSGIPAVIALAHVREVSNRRDAHA